MITIHSHVKRSKYWRVLSSCWDRKKSSLHSSKTINSLVKVKRKKKAFNLFYYDINLNGVSRGTVSTQLAPFYWVNFEYSLVFFSVVLAVTISSSFEVQVPLILDTKRAICTEYIKAGCMCMWMGESGLHCKAQSVADKTSKALHKCICVLWWKIGKAIKPSGHKRWGNKLHLPEESMWDNVPRL